eukprot:m.129640 g.129640  ORF g.129640 m.129640 type:complete len:129 (+) comp37983_c0_seq53:34-420(+)
MPQCCFFIWLLSSLPSCLFTSQEFTSTESEFIFKWSNDNIVAFFSLHSQSKGEQVPYLSLPSVSAVSVLCISHDHRMLAIGHDNGFVSVYDKLISMRSSRAFLYLFLSRVYIGDARAVALCVAADNVC